MSNNQDYMEKNREPLKVLLMLVVFAIIGFSAYYVKSSGMFDHRGANNIRPEYQNQNQMSNQTKPQEPKEAVNRKVTCHDCKGEGVIICKMCNGTGVNNNGADCGCVTYVINCIRLGKTPARTALKWVCETCEGTGVY